MIIDIVEVRYLNGYRIFLEFEDGISGEIDLSDMIKFEGVFAPLKDPDYFSRVALHDELGTIYWPNGADLDPVVLYYRVIGQDIPEFKRTESIT